MILEIDTFKCRWRDDRFSGDEFTVCPFLKLIILELGQRLPSISVTRTTRGWQIAFSKTRLVSKVLGSLVDTYQHPLICGA